MYKPFRNIQLELLKQIIMAESDIRTQKKSQNQIMLEKARYRRQLLKVLGSTVAWVLLEYDRPYIRAFSRNLESGFVSGKEGLSLEVLALRASFNEPNSAGILHDITNCLRIGDLSFVSPDHPIQTIELKVVKSDRKMGGKDHRQYARGRDVRDYYETGISTKVLPGWKTIRHIAKERDRHNWRQLCLLIRKAQKKGIAIARIEKCLTYCVFKSNVTDDVLLRARKTILSRAAKRTDVVNGVLTEQFDIPTILPLTCFDLPLKYKELELFGDIGVSVSVDLRRLAEIFTRHGFPSKMIRDRRIGLVKSKISGLRQPVIMKEGLLSRLLYELTSVGTLIGYMRTLGQTAKNDVVLDNESQLS